MIVEQQKKFIIKTTYFILIFVMGYITLYLISGVLFPLTATAVLTVAMQGAIRKWSKKMRWRKKATAVFLIVSVYLAIISVIAVLAYTLYRQLTELLIWLPKYSEQITEILENISVKLSSFYKLLPDTIGKEMNEIPSSALSQVSKRATEYITVFVTSIISSIPAFLLSVAVVIIAGMYLAMDYDEIIEWFKKNLKKDSLKKAVYLKDVMLSKIFGIFKGYSVIMFITFTELLLGLLLLKCKYALIIAAITALLDILPVVGAGLVLIPWAVVEIVFGNPSRAVGLVLLYIIITVVRNVIEPKVMGDKIGIHPLAMLLSVFIGMKLFGAAGIIVAPLAVVALKSLFESRNVDINSLNDKVHTKKSSKICLNRRQIKKN